MSLDSPWLRLSLPAAKAWLPGLQLSNHSCSISNQWPRAAQRLMEKGEVEQQHLGTEPSGPLLLSYSCSTPQYSRHMIISLAPTIDLDEIYMLVDLLLMHFGEK
jgi:hypothetical protein